MAGKLVGIDLGTTFSAIATLDDYGHPVTLPNRDGDMLTPSAVLIKDGAAMAYSFQPPRRAGQMQPDAILPNEQRTVLVYDLGGGTFDVSLVRLRKGRFQTLAIEGDVRLGGKDWDDRIIDHVAAVFQRQH